MEKKAWANIEAAQVLVEHDFCDSATSRAYYAAYLADWAWLTRNGERPPCDVEGRRYWPHSSFASKLFEWGALGNPEQRDDFDFLRGSRVKADYYVDEIPLAEAKEAIALAHRFVQQLQGETT